MSIQPERRRYVRLNVLTDVAYAKQGHLEKEKLTLAKNISAGGICLVVYEELKVSDVLDLKIGLPGESTFISAVGRVVWTKEFPFADPSKGKRYDAGIEFIEISNEDMIKINNYVFTHLK